MVVSIHEHPEISSRKFSALLVGNSLMDFLASRVALAMSPSLLALIARSRYRVASSLFIQYSRYLWSLCERPKNKSAGTTFHQQPADILGLVHDDRVKGRDILSGLSYCGFLSDLCD